MTKNIIHDASTTGFKPLLWYGEHLITRFTQIQEVLREKLGAEYAHLLAEPIWNVEQGKITWLSPVMGAYPQNLPALPTEQQNVLRSKLSTMLDKIGALAGELKATQGFEQLGEVLQMCFDIPSMECVKVEGEKIVLVMWGFYGDNQTFKIRENLRIIASPTETPTKQETPKNETQEPPKEEPKNKPEEPKKKDKKPFNYWKWLSLLLLLLLLLLFLWWLFGAGEKKTSKNLPTPEGKLPKIDTTKIRTDPKDPYKRKILTNRLNLRLAKDTDMDKFAEAFKEKFTSPDIKIVSYLGKYGILQVEVPEKEREKWKEKFKEMKEIRSVFEESVFKAEKRLSDPQFKNDKNSWYFEYIKAFEAWDSNMGDAKVTVAVIDDGFDLSHPELAGKVVKAWNVVENSPNVNANGGKKHGTHVASTAIGNAENGQGVAGIAPNCSLMPLQIADEQGNIQGLAIFYAIAQAINQNADVINLSLGMATSISLEDAQKIPIEEQLEASRKMYKEMAMLYGDLFEEAYSNGIVVVQAAGNSNVLASIDPMKRSANTTIVVGATTPEQTRARFSNFGEEVELCAPGVRIFNAVPNGAYEMMDGTSMASPIVAGAAALMKSINPKLTPAQIKEYLIETGLPVKDNKGMRRVGPIIQLAKAIERAKGSRRDTDCETRVDSLERALKEYIEREKEKKEELVIPCNPEDINFAVGTWEASENLSNAKTGEPVFLHFDIGADGKGTFTLRERNGKTCQAPLKAYIKNKTFVMEQLGNAKCEDGSSYVDYIFQFVSDCNTSAKCSATQKSNTKGEPDVVFYLRKIK